MNKTLYWTLRIVSIILLIPALIVGIPGFIFYFLSKKGEIHEWALNNPNIKYIENE